MSTSRFSQMELVERLRPRRTFGENEKLGHFQSERRFLDFVIDGKSLYELVAKRYDNISVLRLDQQFAADSVLAAKRLMLKEPADLLCERRSLFSCPECSMNDLGCGANSIVVEQTEISLTWKDFGFE